MQYFSKSDTDKFEVVDVYMRPDNTFLQGLYYDPETYLFWEGSGMWGESKVRYLRLDPLTKQLTYDSSVSAFTMDRSVFGEGVCPLSKDEMVVLTWQSNQVYVLNQSDLKKTQTVPLF